MVCVSVLCVCVCVCVCTVCHPPTLSFTIGRSINQSGLGFRLLSGRRRFLSSGSIEPKPLPPLFGWRRHAGKGEKGKRDARRRGRQ